MARHLITGSLILLAFLAGLLFLLAMIQDSFIYFPSATVALTPAVAGLDFEDVRLETSDGEMIAGWYVPADDGVAALLYLHGNGGNIGDRVPLVSGLHRAGFSVLIIDYRGYGRSTGRPDEKGLIEDARAAWKHLVEDRKIPNDRVVIYGESIGAAPALSLALMTVDAGAPPGAVVLHGAFTSLLAMARRGFPFLPVGLVLRDRMDNLAAVSRLEVPTLFIHAGRDEVIPLAMGRELFENSSAAVKEFHEIPGAGHNTLSPQGVWERMRDFVVESRD